MEEKQLDKLVEHLVDGVLTRKVKEVILEENHAKAPQTKALVEDGVDEETWKHVELSNSPASPKVERSEVKKSKKKFRIRRCFNEFSFFLFFFLNEILFILIGIKWNLNFDFQYLFYFF